MITLDENARAGTWRGKLGSKVAFSLIEVNLAVLVVGVGMMVLFALFPVSLDQGHDAFRDSQAAMFAEYTLEGMRGNSSLIDDWSDWVDGAAFMAAAMSPLGIVQSSNPTSVEFPAGSGEYVNYILEVTPKDVRMVGGNPVAMRWAASLWVWGERQGPSDPSVFKNRSRGFYTEFIFAGHTDA